MIIEADVDFLVEHEMSFEQYALCYFLHEDEKQIVNGKRIYPENGPAIANIYKYFHHVRKWKAADIEDLINRGYLKSSGEKLSPDLLEVTDKFKKAVFEDKTKFEQLWDIYPNYLSFGPGKPKATLKACDRDQMSNYYDKIVRTKKKHRYILEITKWARKHDMLKMALEKYVRSKYWEILEEDFEQDNQIDTKEQEMLL